MRVAVRVADAERLGVCVDKTAPNVRAASRNDDDASVSFDNLGRDGRDQLRPRSGAAWTASTMASIGVSPAARRTATQWTVARSSMPYGVSKPSIRSVTRSRFWRVSALLSR